MKTRNLFLIVLVFFFICAHAQQRITLDDMRQRYAEFASQQPIDTTISRENDEVVISSYHCYEKKGQKYKNPRMDKDYAYMLVEKLRTPEYPDRRHYWSLVDYEKVNHHVFKNISHKTPIERRRLKYVHKSFVRYLALDSIDGIGPSLWPKAFKRKYYRPKHKFHYAKAVSDSLFLLNEVRNMLGYTIAPHFEDAVIKKGHVRDYSYQRCEDQMGELMYLGPIPVIDRKYSRLARIRMRLRGLDDEINSRLTVVDHGVEKKSYDLLVIMLPNERADVEMLSCTGEVGPEFEQLRQYIRELPPQFFVRYWTVDGQPLPGFYLQATISNSGTWRFSMDKFLLKLKGRVW